MSDKQIKVRRKEAEAPRWSKIQLAAVFVVVMLLGAAAAFAVAAFYGGFDYLASATAAPLEITTENGRQIIRVPAGGNLQEAVDRARSGDIIELQAGAKYIGNLVLPKKDSTDFITIRSSAHAKLPENARVSPQQAALMPKILSKGKGQPAVNTADGAHHYRFVGIEFAPSNGDYIYNLVYFGAESSKTADVPHDLEIDRCYIHSIDAGKTRRGLGLNSANTTVKNSYFEGFAYPGEETQGICGWTGTKNVKIINNYVEGGAENVMFGGSDPASAELIPQDIEVRGNHFNKPLKWKQAEATLKCLFELKNAKRVQFVGNYLENNWVGSAFRITVRNDEGTAPFNTLEDVLIKDNFISGAGDAVNILGKDDGHESRTMRGLTIVNNVFVKIGEKDYEGSGYFIQVADGKDILIANNTVYNHGNIAKFHGGVPENFVARDNIVAHNDYGVHGLTDVKNSLQGKKFFQNNVFVNTKQIEASGLVFPPNNYAVQNYQEIGFINEKSMDFRLSPTSRFKKKGSSNADIGANLDVKSLMK